MIRPQSSLSQTPHFGEGWRDQPVSVAVGPDAERERQLAECTSYHHLGRVRSVSQNKLESGAFDLKAEFARFAMHFDRQWRDGLFLQIDQILDQESWDEGDILPKVESWKSCLRLLTFTNFKERPGLGMHDGDPVLSWRKGQIRVSVRCLVRDRVHWSATRLADGERIYAAGDSSVTQLSTDLTAFNQASWLFDGKR